MKPIPQEHPFTAVCATQQAICMQEASIGLSIVCTENETIAFYGDTKQFLVVMEKKIYYTLLFKMLYLTTLGVSPTFFVDRYLIWSDTMMRLECDRIVQEDNMLHRFFDIVETPANHKMAVSPNALRCSFKPIGFRYNSQGRGQDYKLDISFAYDRVFVRRVYDVCSIAEQFNLPTSLLHWMGEVGDIDWWQEVRNLASRRSEPMYTFNLPSLE